MATANTPEPELGPYSRSRSMLASRNGASPACAEIAFCGKAALTSSWEP
jgi:hypothetical protein